MTIGREESRVRCGCVEVAPQRNVAAGRTFVVVTQEVAQIWLPNWGFLPRSCVQFAFVITW